MMKERRKISIILATHNRAHMLRATVDSILAQTYEDFELIVVDDGSTDDTRAVLSSYDDARIRTIFLKENQFYCVAANEGIRAAEGEYIAFATSDDLWDREKLRLQTEYLDDHPECGACFSFADVIDEEGQPDAEEFEMVAGLFSSNFYTQKEWVNRFVFDGNCLCHPSATVRREVLDEVGYYHLMYCQAADMELWLRIVRKYPIHVIERPLVHYRCYRNPGQQVSGEDDLKSARFVNEHMIIRKNFINDLSDEEMKLFFGDLFRNPGAAGHLQMQIEKAFLLMDCVKGLPDLRVLGIEKFEELLRDPEAVRLLKEVYNVTPKDIYQWNLGHFYMDFGIHVRLARQDQQILILREELRRERIYIQALQNYRNELVSRVATNSGRVRRFCRRLKHRLARWIRR